MLLRPFAALALGGIVLLLPGRASAELVTLTTGRTLSVRSVRIDGETAVLALRGGGEVECNVTLLKTVAPDEVPYPEPEDLTAAASVAAPARQRLTLAQMAGTESRPYLPLIEAAALRHQVDPRLVHAVITVESRFQARARSRKGAMGLMQLMPATARELQVRNPFDPATNIDAGVRHLRQLLDRFDVQLAVAAYNAGAGAVRRFGGVPPFRETQSYVRQVLQLAGVS
ncbi:Membrane-bound lytic murein transglycosylase C precursor [Luteitalea pratensis]|uniref:Membrane-bound lytic murein transglycosylase C n=1 Tax=Luteitalea pratensis TaxID=1855912 RepID=A0A143PQ44_LUTPR|nr:lytic transglycosylase domain-containing protein [Luteitalea pratensis]AMY10238.1 Membrane-bound lytic murein transglycosylase C precursor [Luteitalea pratensis]